jgi:hypothetical protein
MTTSPTRGQQTTVNYSARSGGSIGDGLRLPPVTGFSSMGSLGGHHPITPLSARMSNGTPGTSLSRAPSALSSTHNQQQPVSLPDPQNAADHLAQNMVASVLMNSSPMPEPVLPTAGEEFILKVIFPVSPEPDKAAQLSPRSVYDSQPSAAVEALKAENVTLKKHLQEKEEELKVKKQKSLSSLS